MSNVSYVVSTTASPAAQTANKNKNPNDPNIVTTGAYGSAFQLALDATTNADGTVTDTLTYKSYTGKTNGSFSAVSEQGKGSDLSSAYAALLATLQSNGEQADASQLGNAFGQLNSQSQGGSQDASVSGGGLLVQAGGPVHFSGISSAQNDFVDQIINDLSSQLHKTGA